MGKKEHSARKKAVPFVELIGGEVEEVREGYSRMVLRKIEEKHLNGNGWVHGGLIYALSDSCCGTLMDFYGENSSTIEGKIQYLNNTKNLKSLRFEAFLLKKGNRISFIEVRVTNQLEEQIAAAAFTYYSLKQ